MTTRVAPGSPLRTSYRHFIARTKTADGPRELGRTIHRVSIHGNDDVTTSEASRTCRSTFHQADHEHAALHLQIAARRPVIGDGSDLDAEESRPTKLWLVHLCADCQACDQQGDSKEQGVDGKFDHETS